MSGDRARMLRLAADLRLLAVQAPYLTMSERARFIAAADVLDGGA